MSQTAHERRTSVIIAGHTGDLDCAAAHRHDNDPRVRCAAISALERLDALTDDDLTEALRDPDMTVRRRAVELAATRPQIDLTGALNDEHPDVVEVAAWACGEHIEVARPIVDRLVVLATEHDTPLVREAAAAALGAIGDEAGLPAILAACTDKPHVRRRAVLALAPFDGPDVEAAIAAALVDRDWQVRQAAEDLQSATAPIGE